MSPAAATAVQARGSGWRTLGALAAAVLFCLPLLLLVTGSLRPSGSPPPPTPELWPDPATTAGYAEAVELGGLGRAALNSLLVALVTVPLSTLVASWAGFALTRLPRRWRGVLLGATLVALMVPVTALLVPRFTLYRQLGLTDTLLPLMAPALVATSPFYVLVFYLAFRAVPRDLYDASLLADLSPLRTWWSVGVPLVWPVTIAVAALTFVLSWSNFLEALVYVYDRDLLTLPLALRSLSTLDPSDYPVLLAGSVLATVPALLLFGVAQRSFLHSYRGPGWLGR